MANKIKKIIINIFGDGFFGLENNSNTQEEITNGYREYQKKHKKPEPKYNGISYGDGVGSCTLFSPPPVFIGSCASIAHTFGNNNVAIGRSPLGSCNDLFIESHFE